MPASILLPSTPILLPVSHGIMKYISTSSAKVGWLAELWFKAQPAS